MGKEIYSTWDDKTELCYSLEVEEDKYRFLIIDRQGYIQRIDEISDELANWILLFKENKNG